MNFVESPQVGRPLCAATFPGNVDGSPERFPDLFTSHSDLPSNRTSIYSQVSTTSTTPSEYSGSEHDFTGRPRTLSTSPAPRSRRDKKELHAARLQRSGSNSLSLAKKDRETHSKPKLFHRGSDPASALAAIEPPHETGLTRMAYADQQRWVTVQQKTFTKWCGLLPFPFVDAWN